MTKKSKKENEPLSSLTHLIGLFLSIAGLVLLLVFAAKHGSASHVVGFSIFGASLILVYFTSALYHFISKTNRTKKILQKIDHLMIFILIAGTYTPICLVVLRGWVGWSLFGIIWALSLLGIALKIKLKNPKPWFFPLYYAIMGWVLIIAIIPLLRALPSGGIFWLFMGGISYTIGIIFFSLDKKIPRTRWFGMHEIFHIFVILGSFSHFWLMIRYVVFI